MPATLLSEALRDFGSQPRFRAPPLMDVDTPQQPSSPPLSPAVAPDPDRIAAEVETAVAEATALLEENHAAALASEKNRYETEIARLNAEFGERAATVITDKLSELENRLTETASSVTARLLGVVLSEDIQKRSLEDLAKTIHRALADREAVTIRITGPQSLFEALRPALGDLENRITYVEGPGFDLTVELDEQLFATRLSEWSEMLSGVIS